jgi:hypothetical protein
MGARSTAKLSLRSGIVLASIMAAGACNVLFGVDSLRFDRPAAAGQGAAGGSTISGGQGGEAGSAAGGATGSGGADAGGGAGATGGAATWLDANGGTVARPALVWGPSAQAYELVILGADSASIWATSVAQDGTVGSWANITGATFVPSTPPAVAWNPNGNKYYVVAGGAGGQVYGRSLDAHGTAEGAWFAIDTLHTDAAPAAACDESGSLYVAGKQLGTNRITAAQGTVTSSVFTGTWNELSTGSAAEPVAAAWDPNQSRLVLVAKGVASTQVFCGSVAFPDGITITFHEITGGSTAYAPSAARTSAGSEIQIAARAAPAGTNDLWLEKLDAASQPPWTVPFAAVDPAIADLADSPALARQEGGPGMLAVRKTDGRVWVLPLP